MRLFCQPIFQMSESIITHSFNGGGGSISIETGSKTAKINLSQEFEERDSFSTYYMISAFTLNISGSCMLYINFPSINISGRLTTSAGRDVDSFTLQGFWACRNNNQLTRAMASNTHLYQRNDPNSNRTVSATMPSFSMCIPLITPEVEIGMALSGDVSGDGSGFSSVTLIHSGVSMTCEYSLLILS